MSDYSRAWSLECLIRLMDARDRAYQAECAFALKGDTKRSEKMKDVKMKIDGLMSQIEEITNDE